MDRLQRLKDRERFDFGSLGMGTFTKEEVSSTGKRIIERGECCRDVKERVFQLGKSTMERGECSSEVKDQISLAGKRNMDEGEGPSSPTGIMRIMERGEYSREFKNQVSPAGKRIMERAPILHKANARSSRLQRFLAVFLQSLRARFCRTYFREDEEVTLQDEHGERWPTKYLHYKHGLNAGWIKFSKAHDLEFGDILRFLLIRRTESGNYLALAQILLLLLLFCSLFVHLSSGEVRFHTDKLHRTHIEELRR
ncbi:hypothetical protein R1flu_023783 [Riccia fluitans]|uniref:TF-B3 domain-containing protein n=1 Tax=Riccia fluitans TaxID=41844 RepID=A0ABD1XVZ4_9MARC